jgi:WD40 repeat protein
MAVHRSAPFVSLTGHSIPCVPCVHHPVYCTVYHHNNVRIPRPLCPPPSAQEYNYHLGAVNTVTFIDDARRFVSSSDDKSLRVWEFGIPVQIK